MNRYTIIPSSQSYSSAPILDQKISITLDEKQQLLPEYDRNATINLIEIFENERQLSTVFRPTFKISYLYENTITGTTSYLPFQYNLYYVDAVQSVPSGVWKGFPQYFEFDFFRPNISDQHLDYYAKSAYTYNWSYYFTYPYQNNPNQILYTTLCNIPSWVAKDGIPFTINFSNINGSSVVQFVCVSPHGLTPGEFVKLSFSYNQQDLFEVFELGNGQTDSDTHVFNIFNYGYTGTTFQNGKVGTFKRVLNPDNTGETTSKYYVRQHKILKSTDDILITKSGFEKTPFRDKKQLELSSLTPNNITRISQKTSSNCYNITSAYDIELRGLIDNQKRPLTELYLTIVHKGYTGYFYDSNYSVGIKRGWLFNLTTNSNSYWNRNNTNSNSNIPLSGYTKFQSGQQYNFVYSAQLKEGDIIDGDFCEWNDYEQAERVVSPLYHKINYNNKVFSTLPDNFGYYYKPHNLMTLKVFSDYVETANLGEIENVPSWSYFSNVDQQFRWRDVYTYGFFDNLNRGVDYPYLNSAHYPFSSNVFRLIPEGVNFNQNLEGINFPLKPLVDECE